ncbi:phospholipid phosphatase 2-like isoform X2 [Trichoplusia ni]|uniref:Phospholipid phosphatase 2-like isoform X2 n=1 Tax=Trichoplusia ni TaxID=7111 RepID=A0A7E5WGN5_TRINI|nr:phospholipid phosphatase 2-like isoform X2 [Trichoplusia ni]
MVHSMSLFRASIQGMKRMDSIPVKMRKERRDLESQSSGVCAKGRSLWWILGFDIPLLLFILVLVWLFELGVIPFHKSGFYCNDPDISFPFHGDTVTGEFLMASVFLLPLVVVFMTEFIFLDSEIDCGSRFCRTLKNTFHLYRAYIFGFIVNIGIVEVMKGIMGNPRPTFMVLCEPDAAKTCKDSEYVSEFTCTSTKYSSMLQMDASRSFPSGHASQSVNCGLFIAWYLQRRAFNWRSRSVFAVPVLQLCCLAYAATCSLTRITDHRHHWWDVLVGTVIGIATAAYAAVICADFSSDQSKASDLKSEESQQTVGTLLYDERRPVTAPQ